jgi:TolB-like protein
MIYRFDRFTLDTLRRELRDGDAMVAVEPQVFDLLRYLIEARDRVVTKDEMVDAVWQGRIVSDATLSSRLNAARVAVGDSGAAQRLIRTLPRKGVRFVGDVRMVPDAVADELPAPRPGAPRSPALAVLPFANLSGDPAQDYFADGMTEEIITALSRNRGLFVIARSSSFTYRGKSSDIREVGRDLGVGYVLEGSVQRSGERLRISGQLIDAATGAHLWAERFDGALGDVFTLQEQVAESVAAAIEPTLQWAEIERLTRNPPQRPDAYDWMLRAYAQLGDFTPTSMAAAVSSLEQALAFDPDYAQAMAALAYARAQCHFQGWITQDTATRAAAVELAWTAVERAGQDAQVLWMAAFAIWNMAGPAREPARALFRRSLLLNPNSAMALTLAGWIETMCGNIADGRAMVMRGQRLSPRDPRGWFAAGVMAIAAVIEADYAGALAWAERALAQNRRFAVALRTLAVAHMKLGQEREARAAVGRLLAIEPKLTVSGFLDRIPVPLESMARTYAEALTAAGLPP